ncbi:epithelial stromal interaction 1 [Ictidomys tridecemlineatus]|nr:epithelial stromal interaction 1 [Ictidomys tridecemlineatus]
MYTRSKVVGSRLGATPASQDPSRGRGELGPLQSQRQGVEAAPGAPWRESLGHAGQGSTGAYTMIAPNESRRHQIQRIAAQELSNLEKWKEQNRAKPVYVVPTLLGGSQSETEVRQKQQLQLKESKYQQKLKRQESVRIRKEAEEAELQKMKAIQREKSNKLEEKKQVQEKLRREAFREHHQYTTAAFLSKLDAELPNRSACQTAPRDLKFSTQKLPALPTNYSWAGNRAYKDSLREKENQRLQKIKDEQKHKIIGYGCQVNNAFLDRLQGKSQPGGLGQSGGYWNTNCGNSWLAFLHFLEWFRHWLSSPTSRALVSAAPFVLFFRISKWIYEKYLFPSGSRQLTLKNPHYFFM